MNKGRRQAWVVMCVLAASSLSSAGDPAFPMFRELAGDAELPPPYGVTATYYRQTQGYRLTDLSLVPLNDVARNTLPGLSMPGLKGFALPPLPTMPTLPALPSLPGGLPLLGLDDLGIRNRVEQVNVQLDIWLFPFLNLYGLVGTIDGRTRVETAQIVGGDLMVEYDGVVYGFGAVASYAVGPFFGAVNAVLTQTELDASRSRVAACVVMPQVGYSCKWGAAWVGAMYQQADESHEGLIAEPGFGAAYYFADLEEEEPWSCLLGARAGLPAGWSLDMQVGGGSREFFQTSLAYRF
ncbi:MAG: hypothetical protein FJ224_08350 [Lentisphaerae bacterium]|nr:hypothetical protein [Lentisphaerota bacterium]